LVSHNWFRRTENITELGGDYKEVGRKYGGCVKRDILMN